MIKYASKGMLLFPKSAAESLLETSHLSGKEMTKATECAIKAGADCLCTIQNILVYLIWHWIFTVKTTL